MSYHLHLIREGDTAVDLVWSMLGYRAAGFPFGFFLLLIAAGAFACCRRGGAARRLTIAIGWIVLYCWLMTTTVLSIQRYMVPAMGLLFVLIPGMLPRRHADGGRSEVDRRFEGQGP